MPPKFLGALVVERGTGTLQAEATISILDDWEATDHLFGAVFDITSLNTDLCEGPTTYISHLRVCISSMFMTAFKEQPKETKVNLHPTTDFCKDIIVVNDPAERAVKDVAEYADDHTPKLSGKHLHCG